MASVRQGFVMNLRECPDCGSELASYARTCPHCGRPGRRSHISIQLVGAVGLIVFCLIAWPWPSTRRDDTASSTAKSLTARATLIARPYRHFEHNLDAVVSYNRTLNLFRIENRDEFTWTDCQITFNSRGISEYRLSVELIKPGLTDAALLHSSEFVDSGGMQFDPSTDRVARLELNCGSPRGRLQYGGEF
jgi:zinc-ribbon domain